MALLNIDDTDRAYEDFEACCQLAKQNKELYETLIITFVKFADIIIKSLHQDELSITNHLISLVLLQSAFSSLLGNDQESDKQYDHVLSLTIQDNYQQEYRNIGSIIRFPDRNKYEIIETCINTINNIDELRSCLGTYIDAFIYASEGDVIDVASLYS